MIRLAFALALMAMFAGCGTKVVVRYNGKAADEWSKQLQEAPKSDARMNAVAALKSICEQDPTQVSQLVVGLKHPDDSTRFATVVAMEGLGAKAAGGAAALQELVAKEDEQAYIKKKAQEVLGLIQPAAPAAPAAPATAPAAPAAAPAAPAAPAK